MKKTIILLILVLTPMISFCQNETSNETTIGNQTSVWYEQYLDNTMQGDTLTLVSIIGLIIVYFLGKVAFKIIKWAILILIIVLLIKVVLF